MQGQHKLRVEPGAAAASGEVPPAVRLLPDESGDSCSWVGVIRGSRLEDLCGWSFQNVGCTVQGVRASRVQRSGLGFSVQGLGCLMLGPTAT